VVESNSREVGFASEQRGRVRELERSLEELQQENLKLRVHEEESTKLMARVKEENSKYRADNAAMER
jgi:DNA-binding HxlR family transcriptional regulator